MCLQGTQFRFPNEPTITIMESMHVWVRNLLIVMSYCLLFWEYLTLYYKFLNTLVEEPPHVVKRSLGEDKGIPICWHVALTIWKGWCTKPFYCCKQKARLLHLMVDSFELNFHRQLIMHCNLLPFIKLKACFFFYTCNFILGQINTFLHMPTLRHTLFFWNALILGTPHIDWCHQGKTKTCEFEEGHQCVVLTNHHNVEHKHWR